MMTNMDFTTTVGEIVTRQPGLARVFERLNIDYCCGGKPPLEEACRRRSLEPQDVAAMLEAERRQSQDTVTEVDAAEMSLTDLADHIEQTHHAYLRTELPRLHALTEKVAAVHGDRDARLREVHATFCGLANELTSHMMKEERILFPMIRQMEAGDQHAAAHCGSVSAPIRQMEYEHDIAGSALSGMRELTDGLVPPEWACNTYRAMLDGLQTLEQDLHQHIHKENNILFPRAIELEGR